MTTKALVTGAGGFVGNHLVSFLKQKNYEVYGVDRSKPRHGQSDADEFYVRDLRDEDHCLELTKTVDEVFHLAADMGGIGYISGTHAPVARNNTLMNVHMLDAALEHDVDAFFYASSACIYPQYKQSEAEVEPLSEDDAYPADPEEGYGWEKLYMEKLCQYYYEDHDLPTYVFRFHNVYGPVCTYEGGREKAPAAICRKVAEAEDDDEIEVWGDGEQSRSFMFVDDCVEGIHRLIQTEHHEPLNLGTERLITINDLVDLIADIAGKTIEKDHDRSKPQGVRGRNSDNTQLRKVLDWEPRVSLEVGMEKTYEWIDRQVNG